MGENKGCGSLMLEIKSQISFPHQNSIPMELNIDSIALDRLHHTMELMFGVPFWGAARDIIVSVNRQNGNTPSFTVAITSALEIFLTCNTFFSPPAATLLLVSAWTWVDAVNKAKR